MRVYLLVPLLVAAALSLMSWGVADVYAHSPTAVVIGNITSTTVDISWSHTGGPKRTDAQNKANLADIDLVKHTYENPDNDGDKLFSSVNIVNNGTMHYFKVTSLQQGTQYGFTLCHPDKDETLCTNTTNNATAWRTHCNTCATYSSTTYDQNKGFVATKVAELANVGVSPTTNSVFVTWSAADGYLAPGGHAIFTGNDTALSGIKIEYIKGLTNTTSTDFTTAATATTGGGPVNGTDIEYEVIGLDSGTQYTLRVQGLTSGSTYKDDVGGDIRLIHFSTLTDADQSIATPVTASSYSTGDVVDGNLQVTLKEDRGWDRILNVALYTNISADQAIENSDTYITWNFFDGVSVTDPHGYFNDVDVVGEQSGVRTQDFTYEITWNKALGANDVIIETKDFQSNVGLTVIENAWTSFPAQKVSHEIPEETSAVEETIAMLWDGGVMNHAFLTNNVNYALLSDVKYFVEDEIIDVSQDEVVVQQEEGVVQLFEKMTLSQDNVKIGHKYLKTLIISGTVKAEFHGIGERIMFTMTNPDGDISKINAVTTSDRTFKVPITIENFVSGTYLFEPIHDNHVGESFSYKH